jgi:hypothetical protein
VLEAAARDLAVKRQCTPIRCGHRSGNPNQRGPTAGHAGRTQSGEVPSECEQRAGSPWLPAPATLARAWTAMAQFCAEGCPLPGHTWDSLWTPPEAWASRCSRIFAARWRTSMRFGIPCAGRRACAGQPTRAPAESRHDRACEPGEGCAASAGGFFVRATPQRRADIASRVRVASPFVFPGLTRRAGAAILTKSLDRTA